MNKFTFSLILIVLSLFLLAGLISLASEGNIAAAIVLGAVAAIVLILTGFGLSTLAGYLHARREQANFTANTRENLAIMTAMQNVQNQQNAQLMRQVRQTPALAAGPMALTFDEGIFNELDGEVS